jgi:hypothetical protein
LATTWAACLEPACLRAGCFFHRVTAWSAKVFTGKRRRLAMTPAIADLVGLRLAPLPPRGKMTLPSAFLEPFGPSKLWWAFHISMATAWTARALTLGSPTRCRRSGILMWSVLFFPVMDLAAFLMATWIYPLPVVGRAVSPLSLGASEHVRLQLQTWKISPNGGQTVYLTAHPLWPGASADPTGQSPPAPWKVLAVWRQGGTRPGLTCSFLCSCGLKP